ncbi:hypothetical protein HK097_010831 [Rhizophlyctis rosea]|uniref:Uncharacterized protein n=1 Tax=Rhizophlyctis rosea TaxID=64517 RepID=A0AAD5X3X2_9FUNG|nr:hypothetical protein HK097_010831 [Rhizophlyctis rosea]
MGPLLTDLPISHSFLAVFQQCTARTFSSTFSTRQQQVDPKITQIVDQIGSLNLLETAALVDALKIKLNIKDIAMPVAAAAAPAGAPAAAAAAAPAEEKPAAKTEFVVKLEKFDAAAKAKIIKEIKALIPGANLVEAKKFVESVPKVIRENVPKEEAEKIKKTLEALGATVLLE